MDQTEKQLLYETYRLELEHAVAKSIEKQLRDAGKSDAADYVKEAARYLSKASFFLTSARDWVDANAYDQIKMDFMDD